MNPGAAPAWAKTNTRQVKWASTHLPFGTEVVTIPSPKPKSIDTTYAFRCKRHESDVVCWEDFRARCVVRGFQQIPGLNYEETYAPVVRGASLRMQLIGRRRLKKSVCSNTGC